MKVVELPKTKTEREGARDFLKSLAEMVEKGEYDPCAFVVMMIEENAMVPLAVNLTRHEIVSYLAVMQTIMVDSLRGSE